MTPTYTQFFFAWLFWLWLNYQQQAGLLLKFWAFWNVWPWRSPKKGRTLGWIWTQVQLWILLFRAYTARLLSFALPSHLDFPTFIFTRCTSLREENVPLHASPSAALPAVRQGTDPGRLTAGSRAVPRDQQSFAVLCLTATVAASADTDRLFWTEIPAFVCQSKQHCLKGQLRPREKHR